jgi:hypothetical protein
MKKSLRIVIFVLFALMLGGCGGTTASSTSTPTATNAPTPTPQTADQIVQTLKQSLPIGEQFSYTADNDPNHLLGRPGQYTSKVNWIDTTLTTTDTGADISVGDGGSIETFASLTDANARFAYIQSISKSSALFAEYEYQEGQYILRVSRIFTPDQAQAYDTAFKKAVG